MNRKDELLKIFEDTEEAGDIVRPLIEDVVWLEGQLEVLRKLPMIQVNPNNLAQQRATPAQKMYKEYLQQYNNCIKTLTSVLRKDGAEEESPLRAYIKGLAND